MAYHDVECFSNEWKEGGLKIHAWNGHYNKFIQT